MQGVTVKSLHVHHSRVLMAALARTWLAVTTALVHQLTSVSRARRRTAAMTTALSYAAVHLAIEVVSALA